MPQLAQPYCHMSEDGRAVVRRVPVLPLSELRPPFISCVSLDRTEGAFEANLVAHTTGLTEGVDYYLFS